MPTDSGTLSDKALAVFAFAAYHQLSNGQVVTSIVQRDHAGHQADRRAVEELQARGLITADGDDIHFTEPGGRLLQQVVAGLRTAMDGARGG